MKLFEGAYGPELLTLPFDERRRLSVPGRDPTHVRENGDYVLPTYPQLMMTERHVFHHKELHSAQ